MTSPAELKRRELLRKKAYYQKNRERILALRKEYHESNRHKVHARQKAWRTRIQASGSTIIRETGTRYYRSFDGRKIALFKSIRLRIRRGGSYAGRKLLFTREQFLRFMLTHQAAYRRLYDAWKDSGFKHALAPSVDRVDNAGHYTLDNIQLITQSENSRKARLIDYPRKALSEVEEALRKEL